MKSKLIAVYSLSMLLVILGIGFSFAQGEPAVTQENTTQVNASVAEEAQSAQPAQQEEVKSEATPQESPLKNRGQW